MNDKDASDMIQRCIAEIEQLRRQVELLQPRADAYAVVEQILGLLPQQSRGAGIDIVWQLRRQLEELRPKENAAAAIEPTL